MAERLARRDIEQRIERTEQSISGRFGALERVVRPGRLQAARTIARLPSARIVSMALTGAVLGWVAVSVFRRFKRRRRTADVWVDEVLDEADRERARGHDERTALRRALKRELAEVPTYGGERSAGLLSFLLGYAVRTGVQTLVHAAVDRWAGNGSRDGKSEGA